MRVLLGVLGVVLLLAARTASAAPVCMSVAKFNEEAVAKGITARSGTLTFRVKGVDANAGKGALASLVDIRDKDATGGPCVGTYFKVYGPGPDLGKVKDELFNVCCKTCETCTTERGGALGCETWAGEARSSVIFTSPAQTCDIEVRFGGTPNQHSYSVTCDDGKGDTGVGDNLYALEVNRIALLSGYGGGSKIEGATVLSDQFCFEAASSGTTGDAGVDSGTPSSMTLVAAEDVTASSATAGVYPDIKDLSCGDDSEVFLKFVVPSTVGTISRATLSVTAAATTSAEGDGGAIFRVDSNAWSETSLVWSGRPARGAKLGRIGPFALNQKASLDVTSALTGPGTYSFAVAIEPADRNGTHFLSKEASSASPPTLTLEYGPLPTKEPDAGVAETSAPGASDGGCASCTAARPDDRRAPEEDFKGSCAYGASPGAASSLVGLFAASLLVLYRSRRSPNVLRTAPTRPPRDGPPGHARSTRGSGDPRRSLRATGHGGSATSYRSPTTPRPASSTTSGSGGCCAIPRRG